MQRKKLMDSPAASPLDPPARFCMANVDLLVSPKVPPQKSGKEWKLAATGTNALAPAKVPALDPNVPGMLEVMKGMQQMVASAMQQQ